MKSKDCRKAENLPERTGKHLSVSRNENDRIMEGLPRSGSPFYEVRRKIHFGAAVIFAGEKWKTWILLGKHDKIHGIDEKDMVFRTDDRQIPLQDC